MLVYSVQCMYSIQSVMFNYCCCSAYLSSCHRTASDANLLDDPHTFHYNDYFVIGGIRICLEVSDDPMFLWISSNSFPLNLLLVWSHQAEISVLSKDATTWPGCGLNPNHSIRVVVRTTPLPIQPRCRLTHVFLPMSCIRPTYPCIRPRCRPTRLTHGLLFIACIQFNACTMHVYSIQCKYMHSNAYILLNA